MLDAFRVKLAQLGTLSDPAWKAFANRMTYLKLNKDEVMIREGQIEDKIYFIIKGAVRVYVHHDGKEICTNFRFDNQFTSSITSFLTRRPSQYWLRTQAPSEFLVFSHTELYWLYENFVEINTLGRVVMEVLLIDKRQRELDFLTLSAEERYLKLVEEHPTYVQSIPLKYLASFLGITPESLSRIRAKQ
jgi:CRP-like cAMP-binding protein